MTTKKNILASHIFFIFHFSFLFFFKIKKRGKSWPEVGQNSWALTSSSWKIVGQSNYNKLFIFLARFGKMFENFVGFSNTKKSY